MNLNQTAPDLSGLFDMPLPPPPPLSSSGLLRPFVPIVPLGVLVTKGLAPAPAIVEAKAPRGWMWLVALGAFALVAGAAAAGRPAVAFVRAHAPAANADAAPRALREPRMAEVLGARASYPESRTLALAIAEKAPAAPAALLEAPAPARRAETAHPAEARPPAGHDQSPLGVAKAALDRGDLAGASFAYAEATGSPEHKLDGFVGLGNVALQKGDTKTAKRRFQSALDQAPRYFPALLGMADATWDSGDHAGARVQYQLLRREYSRQLPARASARAREASSTL